MARRRVQHRRTIPEPEPRRIPRRGATLPVPEVAPPPVPSPALEGLVEPGERSPAFAGLAQQQEIQKPTFLERMRKFLLGPVYPGPSIAERLGVSLPVYPGPSLAEQILGGAGEQQSVIEQYQEGLPPTPTGEPVTGFDAALAEARKLAQEFSDPMNTIEAAAGHVMVSFQNGYSPPFIMYEVQAHWGWTDAEMKAAGYVRGMGGWKLGIGAEDVPVTTGGDGGAGAGTGAGAAPSWSFPSGTGGARNSFAGSSLIMWRI